MNNTTGLDYTKEARQQCRFQIQCVLISVKRMKRGHVFRFASFFCDPIFFMIRVSLAMDSYASPASTGPGPDLEY